MRVGVGEESSKWRSVRKNVNEQVYAVFGSLTTASLFLRAQAGFWEGFHVKVTFEGKEWRGGWLLEGSSCFTVSKQLPLKMFEFI